MKKFPEMIAIDVYVAVVRRYLKSEYPNVSETYGHLRYRSPSLLHVENRREDNEITRLLVHASLSLLFKGEVALCREPPQAVPRDRRHHRLHDRRPAKQAHPPACVERLPANRLRFPPAFR